MVAPGQDRLWLWGHEAGSHTDGSGYGIEGSLRMTPAEAQTVADLAARFDNLTGVMMDDRDYGNKRKMPVATMQALEWVRGWIGNQP